MITKVSIVIIACSDGKYCFFKSSNPNLQIFNIISFYLSSVEPIKCAGCDYMFYCSRDCQTKGPEIHYEEECELYAEHYQNFRNDIARLLLRICVILDNKPDKRAKAVEVPGTDPIEYRNYFSLETRQNELEMGIEKLEQFQMILIHFREAGLAYDRGDMFIHFCKITMNRFLVENFELTIIGLSIFIVESGYAHSCDPNSALTFNGFNLQVRALKNISQNERITINYCNEITSQYNCNHMLKKEFCFVCKCPKCLGCIGEG